MENNQTHKAPERLSAQAAFVVHLSPAGTDCDSPRGAETLTGRVEHVPSGHSLRFSSVRQLVAFMRRAAAGKRHK
jgi:hypothetical protein